jgi:hypothetical protein
MLNQSVHFSPRLFDICIDLLIEKLSSDEFTGIDIGGRK